MAVLPYRINTVTIKMRQVLISSSELVEDQYYQEPAAPVSFGTEFSVEGQVNLMNRNFEQYMLSFTGNKKDASGHLVIKNPIVDTGGNSITLKPGDKITEIAGVAVDYFIKEVRPESPLNGSFLLWYVEFSSNEQTKESE